MIKADVSQDIADKYLVGHIYNVEHNLSLTGELIEISDLLCVKKTFDIRGFISIELQEKKVIE